MKFEDDGMSVRQRQRLEVEKGLHAQAAHRHAALSWIGFQALTFGLAGAAILAVMVPVLLFVGYYWARGLLHLVFG